MPGICGFGAACADTDAKAEIAHMAHLRDLTREALAGIDGLVLLGSQQAPHIVNLAAGPALAGDHQLPAGGVAGSRSRGVEKHRIAVVGSSSSLLSVSFFLFFPLYNPHTSLPSLPPALPPPPHSGGGETGVPLPDSNQ